MSAKEQCGFREKEGRPVRVSEGCLINGNQLIFFLKLLITLLNIAIMQYYKIQIQDMNTNTLYKIKLNTKNH